MCVLFVTLTLSAIFLCPDVGSTLCWCSPQRCLANRHSRMSLLMDWYLLGESINLLINCTSSHLFNFQMKLIFIDGESWGSSVFSFLSTSAVKRSQPTICLPVLSSFPTLCVTLSKLFLQNTWIFTNKSQICNIIFKLPVVAGTVVYSEP